VKKTAGIYIALILAMIFWAFSFIWFKIANETFRPVTIILFRLVLAVVILSIFLLATKGMEKIRKEDRRLFFMLALFEPFLYFLGESFGLSYVSATVGSVIISTIPVFVSLGAWLIFREQLKMINYAGIAVSFIGVIVFLFNRNGTLSFNISGLVLLSLAVFSAVGYNLTLTTLVGRYKPVFIVYIQNVIGSVLFLPLFLIFDLNHFINTPFLLKSFIPILELSVFASCGAFILFALAVNKMGVTKASIFTNCIPVLTAFFSFLILGDRLTIQNMAGMIIVIAGIFMSQINGHRKNVDDASVLAGKTA
jgi:drug/metabolite transporter (DMT)-like permease